MVDDDEVILNPLVGLLPLVVVHVLCLLIHGKLHQRLLDGCGTVLRGVDDPLPVDVENDIARLTAGAAEKLLQQNSAEVQQKQAQQQQQDPIVQMQQQELAIKQQEAQAKAQKMAADVELEKAKLELDKMKIDSQERIAGAKIGSEVSQQQAERNAKDLMEGTKMGMQAVQQKQDFALRAKESRMRDETDAHEQKLKDKTEIDVTKDEDNTN